MSCVTTWTSCPRRRSRWAYCSVHPSAPPRRGSKRSMTKPIFTLMAPLRASANRHIMVPLSLRERVGVRGTRPSRCFPIVRFREQPLTPGRRPKVGRSRRGGGLLLAPFATGPADASLGHADAGRPDHRVADAADAPMDDLLVQCDDRRPRSPRRCVAWRFAAAAAPAPAGRRIEKRRDLRRQRRVVARLGDQVDVVAVVEQFRGAVAAGGDHRQSARRRLQHHETARVVDGRVDVDVGGGVVGRGRRPRGRRSGPRRPGPAAPPFAAILPAACRRRPAVRTAARAAQPRQARGAASPSPLSWKLFATSSKRTVCGSIPRLRRIGSRRGRHVAGENRAASTPLWTMRMRSGATWWNSTKSSAAFCDKATMIWPRSAYWRAIKR